MNLPTTVFKTEIVEKIIVHYPRYFLAVFPTNIVTVLLYCIDGAIIVDGKLNISLRQDAIVVLAVKHHPYSQTQ